MKIPSNNRAVEANNVVRLSVSTVIGLVTYWTEGNRTNDIFVLKHKFVGRLVDQ